MSIHVAIVGIDGCGKSTCYRKTLEMLSRESSAAGIGDDVWVCDDDPRAASAVRWIRAKRFWAWLAKRCRQKTLYQITKFAELMCRANVVNAVAAKRAPDFIVTDGCPLVNAAAWGSYYHPQFFEPEEYRRSISYMCHYERVPPGRICFYLRHIPAVVLTNVLRLGRFRRPDIIVFLNIDPAAAVKRILARGEKRQVHETEDFLGGLQKAYGMVCDLMRDEFGCTIHRISVDEASAEDTAARIVGRVRDYERDLRPTT